MPTSKRITCPACGKAIDGQADLEIPTSENPSPSMTSGVTHGSLVLKDEEYFLVFEAVVTCPYCKEIFGYDVWLRIAQARNLRLIRVSQL